MLRLAAPVVVAEVGWVTMGLVDTLMVGGLGPEAIGAVGIGTSVFMGVSIFAMGLVLGLDSLVAQAFGAGRLDDCRLWLLHGAALSASLTLPVTIVLRLLPRAFGAWGLDPAVLALLGPYLDALTWSVFPLLLYAAFRRYLQGMGVVRPVMAALAAANVLNLIVNWILIHGRLGAPAMGVRGSAWATVAARAAMAGILLAVILRRQGGRRPGLFGRPWRLEAARMRTLLSLGLPAASQVTLEVGVFAAATALAGRLAPAALAAHQVAINIIAFTFMVPLGIASAGAVRVGHALGRGDARGAVRAGWTAMLIGALFMAGSALAFLLLPRVLIGAFSSDPAVVRLGASLLFVGALFQVFDGVQGVATGVLRGLGDTRTPMLWNFGAHWLVGLPLGYTLCFRWQAGVVGLWWGLSLGLIICGVALAGVWSRRAGTLLAPDAAGPAARED